MFSREATNTNFIVFGLTQSELEPTIYCAPGEYSNHYITDAVHLGFYKIQQITDKYVKTNIKFVLT
jgi:hypothetical protein